MFGRKHPDVLVAGAGPVGLFTALSLAARGMQVEVVEPATARASRPQACALHAASLTLIEELGLLPAVLNRSVRVRRIGLHDGPIRRSEASVSKLSVDHSFVAVLRQEDLEEIMTREAERRGVRIRTGHRVGGVVQDGDSVRVRVESCAAVPVGRGVQHIDDVVLGSREVQVPFVIGADGKRSAVRTALGIGFVAQHEPQDFVLFEFRTDPDLGDEIRLGVEPGATTFCWPLPGGYGRFGFEIAPDAAAETDDPERLGEPELRRLLATRAPWFRGRIGPVRWRRRIRVAARLAERAGSGHVWLVGDALHEAHPAGAQSMNVGFREGRDLAEALSPGAAGGSLLRYERARRIEWDGLLGHEPDVVPRAGAAQFVGSHAAQIIPSLPASGRELEELAAQLGLDLTLPLAGRSVVAATHQS
jgi:2-polyprenyl-6-methoxyphenol hydroxylase-like FAD-dependent oxidoreductase